MKRAGIACFLLTLLARSTVHGVDWDVETPLDNYVNRFDPHYQWFPVERLEYDDYTLHHINMTSQMWMDYTVTQEPIWWHYVSIFVPKVPVIRDAAYMYINGGSIGSVNNPPTINSAQMRRVGEMCKNVGVVSVHLNYVPFQPQHFVNSPNRDRVEDQIIGHTWKLYIEDPGEPNPDIVALQPMTKAAKHALDTVQSFMKDEYPTEFDITKFMPSGISKRGWVTWLLACVDKRVFALAPTVMDLLNMQENLEHHYRSLGGWSWAFVPYWLEDVPKYLYHDRFKDLEPILDALYFKERLENRPKLMISATGDQFFLSDDSHYFYDQMPGPKYMMLCENTDHGLGTYIEKIQLQLQAFFIASYRGGIMLPQINWTRTDTGHSGLITVRTSPSVISISAWMADSTRVSCEFEFRNSSMCRRDFRLMTSKGASGVQFHNSEVTQTGVDQYKVEFPYRDDDWGFRASFIEMTFPGPDGYQFRFTTELNVTPDILPYPKCETEEQCRGILV